MRDAPAADAPSGTRTSIVELPKAVWYECETRLIEDRKHVRWLGNLALGLVLCCVVHANAWADKRVALVIGNGAYANAPRLSNPPHDAEDVASALRRMDFDVIVGIDLGYSGMQEAVIGFARAAQSADVGIFYYSGHAIQFNGVNYLMSVDAKLDGEADLYRFTKVDDVLGYLQRVRALKVVVLDSCRDNPLAETLRRSLGSTRAVAVERGLARMAAPSGTIISYSTQPGRTAADGTGRHSPYTAAFLEHIEEVSEIGDIFRDISADVYRVTNENQLPELSLSIIGRFYLKSPMSPPDPSVFCAAAGDHWRSAEAIGSLAAFEDHLARFPSCAFAGLAKARIDALKTEVPADKTPPGSATPSHAEQTALVAPAAAAGTSVTADSRCHSGRVAVCALSAAEERALKPADRFKECQQCPEMVVVPAGRFTMGAPGNEPGADANDKQQVGIAISKPFAVGSFAVTFDEWDACAADGGCGDYQPSDRDWGRGRRPVINVSWHDAQKYVAWIKRKTGKTYRLLSEAEREYVTRAGTTTPFWWGTSVRPERANYDGSGVHQTVPVDSFAPNPWGLYNVHGNVHEWTQDCWNETNMGNPGDGSARTSGNCDARVNRGGNWVNPWFTLRASYRHRNGIDHRDDYVGFRVARTLTP